MFDRFKGKTGTQHVYAVIVVIVKASVCSQMYRGSILAILAARYSTHHKMLHAELITQIIPSVSTDAVHCSRTQEDMHDTQRMCRDKAFLQLRTFKGRVGKASGTC